MPEKTYASEDYPMKNAKLIGNIGQLLLVIGSALYVVELLPQQVPGLVTIISIVYAVSLVLMLIGWIGTKEERKAKKAAKKAERQAAKAAQKAA